MAELTFELYPWRFSFTARDSLHFPSGKSGNVLRGALGTVFRRIACVPECRGPKECEFRQTCAYARIFEPSATGAGPSGLADWPRPFVFRAAHLDGRTVPAGEHFHFDLHVFEMRDPPLPYFALTFAQLAREGLGPGRGRAELTSVEQLDESGKPSAILYDGATFRLQHAPAPLTLPLDSDGGTVNRVVVRFITPTELKSGQQIAARPEFGVLFARVRDRVTTLRALYGAGPLEIDFKGLGERAAAVRMTRCNVEHVAVDRMSSRTGQVHPLGGFVGEAEYEGELAELLPWLRAAKWTGAGRQTVWGKGSIEVATAPPRHWVLTSATARIPPGGAA